MVLIKCQRCSLEWDYQGSREPNENYPVYVACPRCKTSVKLKQEDDNGRS